eukprot:TRINITY_DN17422_c0_g1_i1.p1 TRINITY_DN17422_c0_g1~~TRINITY_DN17422_c0_g1_i1.p1  ORF type:complete len:212 (+),score=69.17 TRINITY_DN17422_c0_g1_i1:92-727(+)
MRGCVAAAWVAVLWAGCEAVPRGHDTAAFEVTRQREAAAAAEQFKLSVFEASGAIARVAALTGGGELLPIPVTMRTSDGSAYACSVGEAPVPSEEDMERLLHGQRSVRQKPGILRYLMLVMNDSDHPVRVLWLDWEGQEKLYAVLEPGEWEDFLTYEHHVWAFRYDVDPAWECGALAGVWLGDRIDSALVTVKMTDFKGTSVRRVLCEPAP